MRFPRERLTVLLKTPHIQRQSASGQARVRDSHLGAIPDDATSRAPLEAKGPILDLVRPRNLLALSGRPGDGVLSGQPELTSANAELVWRQPAVRADVR